MPILIDKAKIKANNWLYSANLASEQGESQKAELYLRSVNPRASPWDKSDPVATKKQKIS